MTTDLEQRLRAFTAIMTLGGNFDTARAVMFEAADELARLRAENERLERNRDMWKAQCERQALTVEDLRAAIRSGSEG